MNLEELSKVLTDLKIDHTFKANTDRLYLNTNAYTIYVLQQKDYKLNLKVYKKWNKDNIKQTEKDLEACRLVKWCALKKLYKLNQTVNNIFDFEELADSPLDTKLFKTEKLNNLKTIFEF
ncbi:MAG TPA: hypothetical protein PL131_09475 [Methylotenera sp.]|nr:hypothetical protein [Methylotenera sp.]HPH06092.1 hypothetical protein [Methylotenera sp.]